MEEDERAGTGDAAREGRDAPGLGRSGDANTDGVGATGEEPSGGESGSTDGPTGTDDIADTADRTDTADPDGADDTAEPVGTGSGGTESGGTESGGIESASAGLGDADPTSADPTGADPGGAASDTAPGRPEPGGSAVPRPRGRFLHGVLRTTVALLSVVALGVTGYAYSTLDTFQDNVNTTDALRSDESDPDPTPPPPENDGATDILLVGTDSRTDMEGDPLPPDVLDLLRTEDKPGVSTDTLILLRIPHDGSRPTGVSIPRDSWVAVPGGGRAKINSVYGTGKDDALKRLRAEGLRDRSELERRSDHAGRRALVRTVQNFTQVRVDHYAEVNLLGFYLLTETLGGVEVCLNQATSDPDSGADFAAGRQTVSGGEALSFVRQRKNLPRGDLDRIQRQQAFLASAFDKVLSAGTLTDPDRLASLADTMRRSLVLDAELDLLRFAQQTQGIASGDISFVTIPVTDIAAWSPDGTQSIVTVDVEAVREFVDGVLGGSRERPSGGGAAPRAGGDEITSDEIPCVN